MPHRRQSASPVSSLDALKPPATGAALFLSSSSRLSVRRRDGLRAVLAAILPGLLVLLACLDAALCQGQTSVDGDGLAAADSGVFEIIANQHPVGTETFQIKPSGEGWEASGELQLEGPKGAKISETCTLRLDSALRPISYVREKKSPSSARLEVEFGPSETKLMAAAAGATTPYRQIFYLPDTDLAVLDTNFFHQYDLLLRMYQADKGGSQPFNVFIPQEALPGTVNLQYIGSEAVQVGGETRQLDHYRATTEQLQIEIWSTAERAIYRLSIPQANLEVVRR